MEAETRTASEVFEVGKKYTMFNIDSMMAMTHKQLITINQIDNEKAVFTPKGKRTKYILRFQKTFESALFAGWDTPITCDTDEVNTRKYGTMRGNACYNFVGNPEEIRQWISKEQLNPFFDKTRVVAVGDDGEETVVFSDEYKGGNAVIDRMLKRHC